MTLEYELHLTGNVPDKHYVPFQAAVIRALNKYYVAACIGPQILHTQPPALPTHETGRNCFRANFPPKDMELSMRLASDIALEQRQRLAPNDIESFSIEVH